MINETQQISDSLTLVIHCTDNTFCFASRKNNNNKSDNFFIKKFDNNLCNNLIFDFNNFISKENLQKVNKISVSVGPSNFNASRLTVVLARTISQQINCPLDSHSAFELMAKRIALNNNITKNNQSFWIFKKLKRKGYIAGKYEVNISGKKNKNYAVVEKVTPKLILELKDKEPNFQAMYNDKEDLRELLNLSNKNAAISQSNSWEKVFPLYPISPVN